MRQPSSVKLKVTKFRGGPAVAGDRSENFMGKEATPAISKLGCLYLMSGVWGKKNYDNPPSVSRYRSFPRWPPWHIDTEESISCSTESFEAVQSAARTFSIIIKPLETVSSIFFQIRDVKCRSTTTMVEASLEVIFTCF